MTERTPRRKKPRFSLEELLKGYDQTAPRSSDEQAWLEIQPVGREFGSKAECAEARILDHVSR